KPGSSQSRANPVSRESVPSGTKPLFIAFAGRRGTNMAESTRLLLTGLFVAVALFLAWQLSTILLLIFAGILIATLLDAAVHAIRKVTPLPRPVLVVGVAFTIIVLLGAGLTLGGASLSQSINQLWDML